MRYIFFLFFFITSATSYTQTRLSGVVSDGAGDNLPGTSVIAKDTAGKIIAYTIAGENGSYQLQLGTGDYTIEANMLGYRKQSVAISVISGKNIVRDFKLEADTAVLKEVVIAYEPVKLKGDTLVYDAKALRRGTEVVVEDLLKNIPGITITKEGTILFGDTPIEKVMVDGDDFFSKGYSVLTKNMPSKPLDKVEVLQNYSNNKMLKGIEDSNAVALNLTVLEEYKNIWFGDLMAGYGIEDRYTVSGNLMNFSKKYKLFFTTSLNNAGYDKLGNINDMVYNSGDMETVGSVSGAVQLMNMAAGSTRLDEDRRRFNNAKSATLSTILPLNSKAKLKLTGFLGADNLAAYQSSIAVTDFNSTYFENTESNRAINKFEKGYLNAFLNYDFSNTLMLQSSSTLNYGKSDVRNDLIFNQISTQELLETKSNYFDQKLSLTHRWKARNAVLLKGRFFTDKLPQHYQINDYLLGNLFPYENVTAIGNTANSRRQYIGLESDFRLKQKNNDLLDFKIGFHNHTDAISTHFRLFTDNEVIAPVAFQSDLKYNVWDLYARSGYKINLERISLQMHLDAHQLFNRFKSMQGEEEREQGQNPFFINPSLTAGFELSPDNFISASYRYSFTNTNVLQVNDAYVLTGSRNFIKGLGYFEQLQNWSAGVGYKTSHYLNRYSVSLGLEYSRQHDALAYRSQVNQSSALSEAFLIRGGDKVMTHINSHYVIKDLKGTLGLDVNLSRLVYYNEVNGSGLRKNILYSQLYGLSWGSNFRSFFNFNLSSNWTISKVDSDSTFRNSYSYSNLDMDFVISKQLFIKTKSEYYYFGGAGESNNYFFTDAEVNYTFPKDKYSLSLEGRNLFDTNNFTTYSVSDIGYYSNSYKLLPRYILLKFKFRF